MANITLLPPQHTTGTARPKKTNTGVAEQPQYQQQYPTPINTHMDTATKGRHYHRQNPHPHHQCHGSRQQYRYSINVIIHNSIFYDRNLI